MAEFVHERLRHVPLGAEESVVILGSLWDVLEVRCLDLLLKYGEVVSRNVHDAAG